MNYILKPAATLFITAFIIAALLGIVYNLTLEPIARQKEKTQKATMGQVLPQASEYIEKQTEKTGSIVAVFEGYSVNNTSNESELVGYVVQLAPEGYGGKIDLIVGISLSDENIIGIRILKHTESPGFGSGVVDEKFYKQYNNRALVPLGVVRSSPGANEIEAISRSTITTRAVTKAVNEAIEWYNGRTR
ncbi:MAG: RnfABCDGE type electron transport complex subunit G [Treponema sp.]|jgi:electron transport complex protein RnfG|nr:RnfABCDGE type electron transport complex subunit G [Treponema sp.]